MDLTNTLPKEGIHSLQRKSCTSVCERITINYATVQEQTTLAHSQIQGISFFGTSIDLPRVTLSFGRCLGDNPPFGFSLVRRVSSTSKGKVFHQEMIQFYPYELQQSERVNKGWLRLRLEEMDQINGDLGVGPAQN